MLDFGILKLKKKRLGPSVKLSRKNFAYEKLQ